MAISRRADYNVPRSTIMTRYFRPRSGPTPWLMFVLSMAAGAPSVRAQILYQHSGSSDPVAVEGWGLDAPGPGAQVGPINDAGIEAWFVDDKSTGSGSNRYYVRFPTLAESAAADSSGWSLNVNLRVVDIGDSSA